MTEQTESNTPDTDTDPNDNISVGIEVNGRIVDTVTARPKPTTPAGKQAFQDAVDAKLRDILGMF